MLRLKLAYLIVSLLDLLTTIAIYLSTGNDPIVEANPIGKYILQRYGVVGIATYKVLCVMAVFGSTHLLYKFRRKRIPALRRYVRPQYLLVGACAVTGLAVLIGLSYFVV